MTKSKLSKDEVKHIAKLGNLNLSENDLIKFGNQLSQVLDYFKHLNTINTDKIKPIYQILDTNNVFREDEIRDSLTQEKVLKNAPASQQGLIKVKAIF